MRYKLTQDVDKINAQKGDEFIGIKVYYSGQELIAVAAESSPAKWGLKEDYLLPANLCEEVIPFSLSFGDIIKVGGKHVAIVVRDTNDIHNVPIYDDDFGQGRWDLSNFQWEVIRPGTKG